MFYAVHTRLTGHTIKLLFWFVITSETVYYHIQKGRANCYITLSNLLADWQSTYNIQWYTQQHTMTHTEYYNMVVLLTNAQFISMDSGHLFLQPVKCEHSLCLCGTMTKYDIEQTISIIENYIDKILQKMCFYTTLVESRSTFTQNITCAQRRHETLCTAQEKRYQLRICQN